MNTQPLFFSSVFEMVSIRNCLITKHQSPASVKIKDLYFHAGSESLCPGAYFVRPELVLLLLPPISLRAPFVCGNFSDILVVRIVYFICVAGVRSLGLESFVIVIRGVRFKEFWSNLYREGFVLYGTLKYL